MQVATPAPLPHARWLLSLLLPMIALLAITWQLIGSFYYTLDDPYIHLQLADMLGRFGHYGLHLSSYSSPSSSLLWTFWLALWAQPLASWPAAFDLIPLLTNLVILALLLNDLLAWLSRRFPPVSVLWIALAMTLSLNLYWLVMSGMEQLAQVWLTLRVAFALSEGQLQQRRFYLALFALSLLRYESLALVLPVLLWAASQGQHKLAGLTTLGIITVLGGLSLFLHDGLGLGWLPASITAKSVLAKVGHGYGYGLTDALWINISHSLSSEYNRNLLMIGLAWLLRDRHNRHATAILALAASVFLAHLLLGRVQTGRYEIYVLALTWIALLVAITPHIRTWITQWRRGFIALFATLLLLPSSVFSNLSAPWAAQNIHDQQGQMAILVQQYLRAPVAINDLGLVARRNPQPVLDLAGLGTPGAFERRREAPYNSDWILTLMREHNTHFAMIYDSWFPYWPATFHSVAELNMPGMLLGPSSRRVSLYADSEPAAAQLLQAVRAYQADHPDKADWFWIHRSLP